MPIRADSATPHSSPRCTATAKGRGGTAPRTLVWLPNTWGKTIRVTSVNGVDAQLRAVSAEIDALPDNDQARRLPDRRHLQLPRRGRHREPSPHGYGIAIDLNTALSDYWYWRPHDGGIVYRNRMPEEIVAIFEKHGFIWGGKWYHYDTMHFEFRPELLPRSKSCVIPP